MASGVVHLCFHGIGEPRRRTDADEDAYWVSESLFLRVLDEAVEHPEIRLSFDDGNDSDVMTALPALVERDLRATFFVLAGRLGGPGSLDEDDVRTLARHGMVIGSHGMSHVPWRRMDQTTAEHELVDARTRLTAVTGTEVTEAAAPFGSYDRRVLARMRALGYTRVHTSDRRRAPAQAWLQPRYSVCRDDTVESVYAEALSDPGWQRRAKGALVGTVKRLR